MNVGAILLAVRAALAVVLYGFLGWVFLTLWRELRTQSTSLANRRIPPISLFGIGPKNTARHQYNHSKITVGRNPACDCMIDDDTVSAYHAQINYRHNQWWLEDLGSTNGCFINDQRVTSPIVLTSDDRIRFGQISFQLQIDD